MARRTNYGVGKRVLASLTALYLGAYGPGPTNGEDAGTDPCLGGKTDVVCSENKAPTLEGFLDDVSGESLGGVVERRRDRENVYPVSASDPDGDSLQFSYICKDSNGNIVDSRGWSDNSEFSFNFNGNPRDEYTIEARVRDSRGLESGVKSL